MFVTGGYLCACTFFPLNKRPGFRYERVENGIPHKVPDAFLFFIPSVRNLFVFSIPLSAFSYELFCLSFCYLSLSLSDIIMTDDFWYNKLPATLKQP